MADDSGPSSDPVPENAPVLNENITSDEPETKKRKIDAGTATNNYKLEERLNGILCCTVCLDLPSVAVYQVMATPPIYGILLHPQMQTIFCGLLNKSCRLKVSAHNTTFIKQKSKKISLCGEAIQN